MVLGKHEIEAALNAEKQEIRAGRLKEDSPLDVSEDFRLLCEACRRGDLKACQEKIQEGVQINARDRYDYTPLNLASLCGHYEVVRLLLESGALCERDTFEGERCLYNALNDRIRNLLLSYDYSKSRDPLQPLAGHVNSLLYRDVPYTSDITIRTDTQQFELHKFLLSARSPFFATKLADAPQTTSWKVSSNIPVRSLEIAIAALYFGEVSYDFSSSDEDQDVLRGIEKLSQQLEVEHIYDAALEMDRRVARQRQSEEVQRGRDQLEAWFQKYIVGNCVQVDRDKADTVQWDRENSLFADVLLCAVDPSESDEEDEGEEEDKEGRGSIPIGSFSRATSSSPSRSASQFRTTRASSSKRGGARARARAKATLFPAHRAMLIRCEYFAAMFSSPFREAQPSTHLPIVHMDYRPAVLQVVLAYLYTESTAFGLDVAVDVLFAADQLFIDKLKNKAAVVISTLGSGSSAAATVVKRKDNNADNGNANAAGEEEEEDDDDDEDDDEIDIYDVVRAGWDTRMQRLEEFGARYIAYRLERFVEQAEFKVLVQESAARILTREECDSIVLVDDIRHYLDERFRLRFEDTGMEDILEGHKNGNDHEHDHDDATKIKIHDDANSNSIMQQQDNHRTKEEELFVMQEEEEEDEEEDDEFSKDALQYQMLLGKIDTLLAELNLKTSDPNLDDDVEE